MSRLRYMTDVLSRAGGRGYNEDASGFLERAEGGGCWVVADGLGGHGGGEVASRLAVDTVLKRFESQPLDDKEQIAAVFREAESAIRETQQTEPRLHQMRSTLVALFCQNDKALWAHLGDTRLYHFRAGRVRVYTEDHSVPWAMVRAKDITPAQVRHHEDRNRLLRTLGNEKELRPDISEGPQMVRPGDAFLLCTDGFWEYVTESEMEITLCKSRAAREWLERMEVILLTQCEPDHDNYTAMAVLVGNDNSSTRTAR